VTLDAAAGGRLRQGVRIQARSAGVPVLYPQMLTFPAGHGLSLPPNCPWPAMGTVHLANRIHQHRQLSVGDALRVEMRTGNCWPMKRARCSRWSSPFCARVSGVGVHHDGAAHRREEPGGQALRQRPEQRCELVVPGRLHGAGRHRPPLRSGVRRHESHPPERAVGQAVRLPPGHCPRPVDQGPRTGSHVAAPADRSRPR
jgi:hypothetical protein